MSKSSGEIAVPDVGDNFIPAPPSPRTISSIDTSLPSRDSVSAAIALVRAKQLAKANAANGIDDLAEELMRERVFQPRSFSSERTTTSNSSIATDSSSNKMNATKTDLAEIENAIPGSVGSSLHLEKKSVTDITGHNVFSSRRSEAQAMTSSVSLPKRPSFDQQQQQQQHTNQFHSSVTTTTTTFTESSDIPALPSLTSNDSNADDGNNNYKRDIKELPLVDANTLEDVNAFLNQLGVGALAMPSLENSDSYPSINAVDSIEKMRMVSSDISSAKSVDSIEKVRSSISGVSSYDIKEEEEEESVEEVRPETLAEISAFIDAMAKKEKDRKIQKQQVEEEEALRIELEQKAHEKLEILEKLISPEGTKEVDSYQTNDNVDDEGIDGLTKYVEVAEAQVRTSRPSPIYELLADATPGNSRDPPSTLNYDDPIKKADPPSEGSTITATPENCEHESLAPSVSAELLDISKDDIYDEADNEESSIKFCDTSFSSSVRKSLSTVLEVASTNDDGENSVGCDKNIHAGLCNEYKGSHEEAEIQVEETIDYSVEHNKNKINISSTIFRVDSHSIGIDEYESIEQVFECESSISREIAEEDDDSGAAPWALQNASSEKMARETKCEHVHFVVAGPNTSSSKSSNIASILSDNSQKDSKVTSKATTLGSLEANDCDGIEQNIADVATKSKSGEEINADHLMNVDRPDIERGHIELETNQTNLNNNLENDKNTNGSKHLKRPPSICAESKGTNASDENDQNIAEVSAEPIRNGNVDDLNNLKCPDTEIASFVESEVINNDDGNGRRNTDDKNISGEESIVCNLIEQTESDYIESCDRLVFDDTGEVEIMANNNLVNTGNNKGIAENTEKIAVDNDAIIRDTSPEEIVASNDLVNADNSKDVAENTKNTAVGDDVIVRNTPPEEMRIKVNNINQDYLLINEDDVDTVTCLSRTEASRETASAVKNEVSAADMNRIEVAVGTNLDGKATDIEMTNSSNSSNNFAIELREEEVIEEEKDKGEAASTKETRFDQKDTLRRNLIENVDIIKSDEVASKTRVSNSQSTVDLIDDFNDIENTEEEMPAFEVGQGDISPTKISRLMNTIDRKHINGEAEYHLQQFKELIVPLIDGHKPDLIESAQIRQAAMKVDIPLQLVDQFLDDVEDTIPAVFSSFDEQILSWDSSTLEAHNEDEDDISAFLCRVEASREVAAAEEMISARKDISAVASQVEAALNETEGPFFSKSVSKDSESVPAAISKSLSSFDVSSWDNDTKVEAHYEDDNDIAAYLCRVEKAREAAAVEKIIPDATSAVASQGEVAKDSGGTKSESIISKSGAIKSSDDVVSPFLRQFEDLGMEEEVGTHSNPENESEADKNEAQCRPAGEISALVASPTMLINYFTTIGQQQAEDASVKIFQKLIMPVVNGNKPTVIEEAQIRQAALKASVPLEFVDKFIDYVNEEHPEVIPQASSEEDRDFLLKGWEEIEDLNEDAAIAAFLSSKFSTPTPFNHEQNGEEKAEPECNTISTGTRSNQEMIKENSEKSFEEAKQQKYNEGDDKEFHTCPDTIISSSEEMKKMHDEGGIKREYKRCEGEEETKNMPPISIPRVADITLNTTNGDGKAIILVDADTRKACKRIQYYDEGIWQRRTAMATYGWGWQEATWLSPRMSPKVKDLPNIDGVTMAEGTSNFMFNKKSFPFARKNCKLSYNSRTKPHKGYFNVDMNSLQESATFGEDWPKDETPWELRYVRQRFLHERSLSFSRNWFGNLVRASGNDKIKAPVCKPKSMEMPMRNIPDPGDWTPEWYTTWGGRKFPRPSTSEGSFDTCSGQSGSDTENFDSDGESQVIGGSGSYSSSSSFDEDDEWEEAPECGTLVNTRQKIGEHVTKVHPDFTSSLRKSRWRKKYFPAGSFPY